MQSMFTALNIEPESDSDDEIDNSKEIQVSAGIRSASTMRVPFIRDPD